MYKSIAAIILVSFVFLNCGGKTTTDDNDKITLNDIIEQMDYPDTNDLDKISVPICPKGEHIDSIIPIVYGYPSEKLFQESDSGLVYIGGCDVEENAPNWWCNIHDISF